VAGVAGAAGSAMNINYSGCALTNQVVTTGKCVKVNSCATASVAAIMQGGALPSGYTSAVKSGLTDLSTPGTTTTCTMTYTSGTLTATADFPGISAGN
jgi:MSHA pilin protein MshA